jgi:GntR family transcriptional regulator/MocR family aminotransferase
MAKRATALPLFLPPRPPGSGAARWLYESLRDAILEGRLRPGQRLPSTRDLARQLELARGTVVSAFEQLEAEGYVAGAVGAGTRVSEVLPEALLREPGATPASSVRLSEFGRRVELLRGNEPRPLRAFRANEPALDLFPTQLWAQIAGRRLRRASSRLLLGCEPAGHASLREAIADYVSSSRGVACEAAQVIVVSGIQEALDLASRLLLRPGDRAAIEDPGYPGALAIFEAHRARVVPARVDADGVVPEPRRWRGVRLAYLTPAHQYPLGVSLSLARRLELLEWARGCGAWLFEDDYDAEYRYAGRPAPALQGLDRHGVVLFAGSFSKVLFPSLRLGYLVVPTSLVERFSAAKSVLTRHAPLVDQAVLADFLTEGHFARHLRRMREIYAERLGTLTDEVARRLAGRLELSPIEAGLQTVGWLTPGTDGAAVERAAARREVEVVSLHRFTRRTPMRPGLQLGFAAVDAKEIRRGVRELATVLAST